VAVQKILDLALCWSRPAIFFFFLIITTWRQGQVQYLLPTGAGPCRCPFLQTGRREWLHSWRAGVRFGRTACLAASREPCLAITSDYRHKLAILREAYDPPQEPHGSCGGQVLVPRFRHHPRRQGRRDARLLPTYLAEVLARPSIANFVCPQGGNYLPRAAGGWKRHGQNSRPGAAGQVHTCPKATALA
jgi:hypothetical protein